MTEALLSDAELMRRLSFHPELRSRMESLLLAVEDEAGDLKQADAAELRVIEEMRRTGKVALQAWAQRQVDKTSQETTQVGKVWREGKKTLLAHHLWRHRGHGAPIPKGDQAHSAFCAKRTGQPPRLFTTAAAYCHGLWCRPALCPGYGQTRRALRHRPG